MFDNGGSTASLASRLWDQHSEKTVNRYLAALSAVYKETIREWHWSERNPLSGVRKGAEHPGVGALFVEDRPPGASGDAPRPPRVLTIGLDEADFEAEPSVRVTRGDRPS